MPDFRGNEKRIGDGRVQAKARLWKEHFNNKKIIT
jgi:hypothetical protein